MSEETVLHDDKTKDLESKIAELEKLVEMQKAE